MLMPDNRSCITREFSLRGLAYMRAAVGQFYIAILVAGLVNAYTSERQSRDKDPG